MNKLTALLLAFIFGLSCLFSCGMAAEDEGYFTRTRRDSCGRLSVSLSRDSVDGTPLTEEELEKIYDGACAAFSEAYAFLDSANGSNVSVVNSPVSTVFDVDSAFVSQIENALELSALTDGLYMPVGGSLTSLLESEPSPQKADLDEALSHTGADKLEISDTTFTKLDPSAMLDLYAFCDGYALTAACEFLKESKAAYGTVTFNGIAGVFGSKPDGEAFAVEIGNGADGIFNITDGYVALVSADFGSAYDFTDGVLESDAEHIAVYSPDARVAAVIASVGYAHGSDTLLSLYKKDGLNFEAVYEEKDGTEIFTNNAGNGRLYTPITTASEEK